MPIAKLIIVLVLSTAVAFVGHEVSAELPGFNASNKMMLRGTPSASRTTGADPDDTARLLRTSDISTTEVAEARTGFSLVSNLRNTEKEMTNKVPMLKTMTRPADLGATGEVLTSTKTLKRRREGGDDVKTSLDKGHALDQPKRVKTARSEDTSSFLKGKVRQATSQLLFNWLQAKVGPEDAEKRWMETHKTGKAEASLFKVEYTKLYKQHGSMMRKVNTWLDAKRKPVDTLRELKPNQKTLEGALNGEYYNYYAKKLKES